MSVLKVFRGAAVAAVVTFAVNFTVNALYARLLGPSEFGRFGFFVALTTLLGALTDWGGLRYIHQVYLPLHADQTGIALGAALRSLVLVGGGVALLALVPTEVIGLLSRTGERFHSLHFVLLGAAILATGMVANLTGIFIGLSRVSSYNRLGVSVALISLGAAIGLRLMKERRAEWAIGGWLLANACAAMLGYVMARLPRPEVLGRYGVRGIGPRAFLFNSLSLVDGRVGIYLLSMLSVNEQVGLFALSAGLGDMLCRLSSLVSFIAVPGMARDDSRIVLARLAVEVRRMLAVSMVASVSVGTFGVLFMQRVYGTKFEPAVPVLLAYLPGATVYPAIIHLYSFLSTRGFPWVLHRALAATAFLNVIMCAAVAANHGAVGAAAAASAAHIIYFLWLVAHMRRQYGLPLLAFLVLRPSDMNWFGGAIRGLVRR